MGHGLKLETPPTEPVIHLYDPAVPKQHKNNSLTNYKALTEREKIGKISRGPNPTLLLIAVA